MPLPVRPHMPCFDEWQESDGTSLCRDLMPTSAVGGTTHALMAVDQLRQDVKGGMPFGMELGIIAGDDLYGNYWDALIPQIIWRGTDFNYLHTMYPKMRSPTYELDIAPREAELSSDRKYDNKYERKRWVIQKLWDMGDNGLLLPR